MGSILRWRVEEGRWEIWVRELNMLNGQILAEAASEKWFLKPYEQCCVRGLIFSCPRGMVHCLLNKESRIAFDELKSIFNIKKVRLKKKKC
jgi:hypothetical protein